MGHKLGGPQPANHLAAILVGAPTLGGQPIGKNRFYRGQRSAAQVGAGARLLNLD